MTDARVAASALRTGPRPGGTGLGALHGARTGIELHVGPVTGTPLVEDYVGGAEVLAPFYAGHPYDADAYLRKAEAVRERMTPDARKRVGAALRATTPAAAQRLERILAGDGSFVTTGQQTGLFGGPLYTIYKLLTAVRLARSLETVLGQPCLAVFWMASDDHDWAEASHTTVLAAQHTPQRISLSARPDAPPLSMSELVLGDDVTAAIEAMEAVLPTDALGGPLRDLLRRAYRPGESMGSAFAHLMAGLLHHVDAALLDPASLAVKQAARPILARELRLAADHARLLARDTQRLEAAGYHGQVTIAEDASNVFMHDELGRDRLVRDGRDWMLRRARSVLTEAEVTQLLDREPGRFSPNVLLRPVVESALLPTLAYVGGPAEIAYFAQIRCLFGAHGVEPPIVFPRFGVTIVEPAIRKVLDKFALRPEDVRRPFHELVTDIMRDELPDAVLEPLASLRAAITAEYDALAEAAADIDPTLRAWVRRNRNAALSRVESARKKILSHLRKRSAIQVEQLRRAAAHLYPEGVPQERSLNILPLLGRYGDGLLHDIADAMAIALDRPSPAWRGVDCEAGDETGALPRGARAE